MFPYSDCLLKVGSLAKESNTHPQKEMSTPIDECLTSAHNQASETELQGQGGPCRLEVQKRLLVRDDT